MIRLRLSTGRTVMFDNFIDLFDYMIEQMTRRGEL
ncbi:hypothetical protein EDF59_12765 [Novosphingobium sp. ST904]|nr:hypothetical protein EDF59_12765 [Novosphingobium sp. ST904]